MGMIEQQIWAGIAIVLITGIIVGAFKSLISNAQKSLMALEQGQRNICTQVQQIAVTLAEFKGTIAASLQWHEMHQTDDDRQFQAIVARLKEIHDELGGVPCKK